MALFLRGAGVNALFHLGRSQFPRNGVRCFENQGTVVTFGSTGRGSAAQITLKRLPGTVLLDHAVRTGGDTVTAAVAFSGIYYHNPSLVFRYSFFRTRLQAVRFGTLKADARHRVTLKCEIVDLNASFRGHKHAFFDCGTGIRAAVASRTTIGYCQKVLFH